MGSDHRGDHRAYSMDGANADAQAIAGEEVDERHGKGSKNGHSEDLVGNGDAQKHHDGHPHDVQYRHEYAERLGPNR